MPKRYKMKVEVEFECPATVPPNEVFYRYFSVNKKVENDTVKVLESKTFSAPTQASTKARAHNEARRVLQVILDHSGLVCKIIKGFRSSYGGESSNFQVQTLNNSTYNNYQWFCIEGSTFKGSGSLYNRVVNLADPASTAVAAEVVKCAFMACGHSDKTRHV